MVFFVFKFTMLVCQRIGFLCTTHRTTNMVVCRCFSFYKGIFSGSMLNFRCIRNSYDFLMTFGCKQSQHSPIAISVSSYVSFGNHLTSLTQIHTCLICESQTPIIFKEKCRVSRKMSPDRCCEWRDPFSMPGYYQGGNFGLLSVNLDSRVGWC